MSNKREPLDLFKRSSRAPTLLDLHAVSSRRRRMRQHGRPRRTRSLPPHNRRPALSSRPTPFILPPLTFQLPNTWHLWKPAIVYCPPVTSLPRWVPSVNYGPKETELKLCDIRSLDDKFPFPLNGYNSREIELMPDQILSKIITDWRRTPVLSFRHDTRNVISRITPDLVAKWGPDVCQAEADIMWIAAGRFVGTPVPVVHKVLRDEVTGHLIIIMDYIHGSNLVDIWHIISARRQHKLTAKIVNTICTMQKNTAKYPGPAGLHRTRALVHKRFPVPLQMNGVDYDRYMNVLLSLANCHRPDLIRIKGFVRTHLGRFVLANMKLDPSSFVVDKKGSVWIVGWANGGFFPCESELAIAERSMPPRFSKLARELLNIPHDCLQRQYLRAIAALIDGDPQEKEGCKFPHLLEHRTEDEKTKT
ncbi:hypothetical protein F4781DRAFT_428226 [Annulohypoxylon bovei var. microspora]|nr:hypothetical protein F4781DRAFT_428226 [Annulohypoxylon bovei var. microspora]